MSHNKWNVKHWCGYVYFFVNIYTGCPAILSAIFLNLALLFYSLFVNFFSQCHIPLYKRRKMSGQFPLKVPRGLRYLIFRFWEELKKSLHSRRQLFWILWCLCWLFKFSSFLDCFKLFLSDWNLYQIQNVSKQYGI